MIQEVQLLVSELRRIKILWDELWYNTVVIVTMYNFFIE